MIYRVTSPDDVAKLPWAGNYGDDQPLFAAVWQYIDQETDPAKRHEAERLVSWLGMGERLSPLNSLN